MKHFLKYLIGLLAVAAVSCERSPEPARPATAKDFFPVHRSFFQIYHVEDIRYQFQVPETLVYELKTQVVDSFLTTGSDYTYVIYRSKRNVGETNWTYLDTWSARIDYHELVLNEENVPYVKLRLPFEKGLTWNGNAYNIAEEDEYELQETNLLYATGGETFPDCIRVRQSDNDDFIVFLDQRQEIYAKHVGLIYKESTQLHYCGATAEGCVGDQPVEQGSIYKQTLISYGVE